MNPQTVNPDAPIVVSDFEKELTSLINRYSLENRSDTPGFILVNYLESCLNAFNIASLRRDQWRGRNQFDNATTVENKKASPEK